jgi:hypothetical protein
MTIYFCRQNLRDVKPDFDIEDMHPCLVIAKKAKEQFTKAQEAYDQVQNKPKYSHLAGDSPAILGEVDVYMNIIKLMFKTKSFNEKRTKELLLEFLKEPTREHLVKITSRHGIQWESFGKLYLDNKDFLVELYSRTKSRLANATRKMAFSNVRLDVLEESTLKFNDFFGEDILNKEWTRIVNSGLSNESKIKELEGYILNVSINNFMWTAKRKIHLLLNWMDILFHIIKLSRSIVIGSDIALCYVTVYMALIYNIKDIKKPITLVEETVVKFIEQLLKETINRPKTQAEVFELANFYLMLLWPVDHRGVCANPKIFFECLGLLKKREREDPTQNNAPWFQVQESGLNQQICQHLASRKDTSSLLPGAKVYHGKLHGQEIEFHTVGFENPINIRKDHRSRNISGTYIDVTFNVVFNALGPIACNIERKP